jgi:cytochrome c
MLKSLMENKMKSFIASMAVVTGLTFAGSAMSADMPAVAKKNGCASCHAIDKKVVGPAWQAVADKYKGDATAADKLSAKIAKGGSGVWGPVPMPAQPKLSEADNKELVAFILGLAK